MVRFSEPDVDGHSIIGALFGSLECVGWRVSCVGAVVAFVGLRVGNGDGFGVGLGVRDILVGFLVFVGTGMGLNVVEGEGFRVVGDGLGFCDGFLAVGKGVGLGVAGNLVRFKVGDGDGLDGVFGMALFCRSRALVVVEAAFMV